MGDIVVGVDGSANGAAALRWAVAEAALRKDRVVALFAWGYIPPGHAGDGRTFDPEYGRADADAALVAAIEAAVGPERARSIERRVVGEVPTKALLAASAGAELLVVGARGAGGFQRLRLGSVSEGCLHHSTRPLAIIRSASPPEPAAAGEERQTWGPARIVVGVDASDSARRALRWALEEARLRHSAVDVVHAWHVPYTVHSPYAGIPMDIDVVVEKTARTVLDRVVDGEDLRRQPAPVERILACGGAASAVLDAAAGADLVVLGSRGLGGFKGLLLGSVTHHVAHHVRCPLVVIP
jgi:nucleotide-binding universal stress UspA family protein